MGQVKEFLKNIIDQKEKEEKDRAKKAKQEALARMKKKKLENKWKDKMVQIEEEQGPKCVSCSEGYTAKPSDILGVYVFSKRMQMQEWSGTGSNVSKTHGYTTVPHNNFIHFTCHQD